MLRSQAPFKIRWIEDAEDGHLEAEQVAAISQACFGTKGWTVRDVLAFMDATDHIPKVIVYRGEVVGYLFYVLHDRVVEIRQFAVRPDMRRQGIGDRLIKHLVRCLPSLRRLVAGAAVPEYCVPAQLLLRKHEFRAVQTLGKRTPCERYLMTLMRKP